jgi:hypothetical protein
MRLVVWNCWGGLTGDRAERLLALRPDVAIVPEAGEVAAWPMGSGLASSGYEWQGEVQAKGLAVMTFGEWTLRRSAEPPRVPWVLPVHIDGPSPFRLLGIWTVQRPEWPSYASQVEQAIAAYEDELSTGMAVLAGDFNCSAQTRDPRPHLANVERLESLEMVSGYHAVNGIEPGHEPSGTLYWRWQQAAPFHCDFAFLPASWIKHVTSATVGDFDTWVGAKVSDHVPVIIEVDLPPTM